MPSPAEQVPEKGPTPGIIAVCLLLSAGLQIIDNMLPKIPVFPWLRLGLAYVVLLPFLLRYGAARAFLLFMCRNLIALIYGGQVFSSFLISSFAGLFSLGIIGHLMYILYRRRWFGMLGVSICLAVSFNVMQLTAVQFLFIRHGDFYFQLGPLLLWSIFSGGLAAFLAFKSSGVLELLFEGGNNQAFPAIRRGKEILNAKTVSMAALAAVLLALILFVPLFAFQAAVLICLLFLTRFQRLRYLLFAWPFYFYIAWLHLFRSDGIFIFRDWITREGLDNFLFYSLRTTNVIICGQWLAGYIPRFWKETTGNVYMKAVGYALPLLPSLFGISVSLGREMLARLRKREVTNLLQPLVNKLTAELENISRAGERE